MNFFRRKKNQGNVIKPQVEHLIAELCNVLKTHGDDILRGKTKLTLTTPILVALNGYFQKITEGVNEACFQVAHQGGDTNKLQSILFIFDFIQKVLCLKLTSGTIATVCPLLTIEYFKALQVLEIRRVNILSIKGLHLIRRQIKSLKCFHAAFSIDDIVLAFGRNCEDRQTLPMLELLDISYNQVKNLNDEALKLIPGLKNVDASYNAIEIADSEALPSVSFINLGYNMIQRIPVFSNATYNSLTTLNMRNNNLSSLEGLEYFSALISLDVTANCIVDFKDFSQLAALENLCSVRMQDNPVAYNNGYRLCVIRSMSPIKRTAKVSIDGIALNSSEQCHLGANVQPVALTSYLTDRSFSMTSSSSKEIDGSVVPSPSFKSTPRERRKARNAVIGEATNNESSPFLPILIRSSGSIVKEMNSSPPLISKTSSLISISSDVNSLGQKTDYDSWAVEEELRSELNSNASIDDIGGASSLSPYPSTKSHNGGDDSGSIYQGTGMALSAVMNEINGNEAIVRSIRSDEYSNRESDGDTDDDGISVVSGGEMEYAYLVETIPKKINEEEFGDEDVENIFIIFKPPYLIEKADDGIIKFKLDLNYLHVLEMGAHNDMTISLHFDLIREDCKYRQYRFPEEEQYDSFVAAIQPIYVKNHQKKLAEMKYCECLKCGLVFLNRQLSEEYYECPDCGSRMVIEKSSTQSHPIKENHNEEEECDECDGNLSHVPSASINHEEDSSIAIVIPLFKDDTQLECCISSWPNYCSKNLRLLEAHQSRSLPLFESSHMKSTGPTYVKPPQALDIFSIYQKHSTHTKSYSNSPGSYNSSATSKSCNHSRQASKGSIKKLPRSAMHTPVISNQDSLFSNMEEFGKCNHRLKLYLDINFFSKLDEEFLCQIRSDCTGYDKSTIYDSLLVITNKTAYIFVIQDPDCDSPENCVKKLAFCPVPQLRYFQCGFFAQSFLIDAIKPGFRFKFMVGESSLCYKFLSFIEDIIHSHLAYTDVIPSVLREVNPQTLANIRHQVFNVTENIEAKGRRIFEQITKYSHPPLLKTKKMRIKTHQQCLAAKEFVDWLCARKEVASRKDATKVCQELLDRGIIFNTSKEQTFKDDDGLYKFSINGATNGSQPPTDATSIDTLNSDDGDMDVKVLIYQLVKCRILEKDTISNPSTIMLTNSHIFLVHENHQWPLSRLLPPPGNLESRFRVKDMNKITNITTMEFYDDAPRFVRICLVKEDIADDEDEETSWLVETVSADELKKLTDNISKIWEDLFAIELAILKQPTILPILNSYILV